MGLIITSIILSLITGAIILTYCIDEEKKKIWSLLGFLWLIIIIFGCFTKVKANTVGIMYNPFKRRYTK